MKARAVFGGNVVGHRDGDQLLTDEKVGRVDAAGQGSDGNVRFALGEIERPAIGGERQLDGRMLFEKGGEGVEEESADNVVATGDNDGARQFVICSKKRSFERQHLGLDTLGSGNHAGARVAQPKAIAVPVEQARLQLFLKRLDAPGDSGMTDAQRRTCSANAPGAGEGQEIANVTPIHCTLLPR